VPVHVRVGWNCVPEHAAATQTWLVPYLRHAPAPSQKPSSPHCSGVPAVQSLCGSFPADVTTHFPSSCPVYVIAHALQAPVQAFSQQTPSTHAPDEQAPSSEQG